jgi:hypothetical protein
VHINVVSTRFVTAAAPGMETNQLPVIRTKIRKLQAPGKKKLREKAWKA